MISDIFISYASEDRKRVQSLAQALERKGWSVWWDRRIPIGQFFDEVIEEALDAAKAVVVVWTDTSVKSQWVKREAREGLRRRVLFPVMFVEETKIPLEFRDVQTAYLMDWQPDQEHPGFDQFVNDIARQIGTPMNSLIQPPPIPLSQDGSSLPTHQPGETSLSATTPAQVEPVRAIIGGNSTLMSLSVSPGTLTPAFSADTLSYTVNVASTVTSVTVSAATADSQATMSGDVSASAGLGSGQAIIQLQEPGATTGVTIWVTSPGGDQATYRVNVNRAALSGNNNLSAFSVSPGPLIPSFTPSVTNYKVNVGSEVSTVTVTATLKDPNARMTINDEETNSGQAARSISLNEQGWNTKIYVTVLAPNGVSKTYSIIVNRAALSQADEVQIGSKRVSQKPRSEVVGGTVRLDSPVESSSFMKSTERPEVDESSERVDQDRSKQSTASTPPSTQFPPYLTIGSSLLVAMGAFAVYWMVSSTSSPVERDPASFQTTVQTQPTEGRPSPPAPLLTPGQARSGTTTVSPVAALAKININEASASDMILVLGLKQDEAERIVSNRPYRVKGELYARNVITLETFEVIKDRISLHR